MAQQELRAIRISVHSCGTSPVFHKAPYSAMQTDKRSEAPGMMFLRLRMLGWTALSTGGISVNKADKLRLVTAVGRVPLF